MRNLREGVNFNNEDYKEWKAFRQIKNNMITNKEYEMVCAFHAKYYEHKLFKPSKCCGAKTVQRYYDELERIYDKGL